MTVQDLINKLSGFPPDRPVMVSSDAEGNGYSELDSVVSGLLNRTDKRNVLTHPDDMADILSVDNWREVVVLFRT